MAKELQPVYGNSPLVHAGGAQPVYGAPVDSTGLTMGAYGATSNVPGMLPVRCSSAAVRLVVGLC